ncbi:MAG: FAD-dependent monooxygenase [Methylophilaceae bacterium]|nr:FAD-dependent monooxygenase [Methylophilaceae bacterium]
MNKIDTDIILVGAGLVGMAAAISLAQLGYQVVLVDQKAVNVESMNVDISDDLDSRIYAISPTTVQWLKTLGVWQLIDIKRTNPINAMKIFGDTNTCSNASELNLLAIEANAQNLGFIVENQQLMHGLWKILQTLNIKVITNVECESLKLTQQKASLVLMNQQHIEAQLIVAADGSNSWLRAQTDIPIRTKSYQHTAIVANLSCEMSHQNVAKQWFGGFESDNFGSNSVLAFLPLPHNQISIVWSLATEKAQALMNLNDTDFLAQLSLQCGGGLGDLQLVSQRLSFDLSKQNCMRLIAERLVLVGDAAHQIHPMAGQGVNLGFRDVMALEKVLAKIKSDRQPIDQRALREYERARSADISSMMLLTDGLHRLFSNKTSFLKILRNWGLSSINQQLLVKKLLIKQVVS